jgi:hypothetical protein
MVEYWIGAPNARANSPMTIAFHWLEPDRRSARSGRSLDVGPTAAIDCSDVEVLLDDLRVRREYPLRLRDLTKSGRFRFLIVLRRDATAEGKETGRHGTSFRGSWQPTIVARGPLARTPGSQARRPSSTIVLEPRPCRQDRLQDGPCRLLRRFQALGGGRNRSGSDRKASCPPRLAGDCPSERLTV